MRKVMTLRLVSTATGSDWRAEGLPTGVLRRVFARLRSYRHGPDGPAIVAPFS